MNSSDDIVSEYPVYALASPYATSALAIIRVTGVHSIQLLSKLCKNAACLLSSKANMSAPYELVDTKVHIDGSIEYIPLDTAMITPYYAPRSYTGQEGADICIHGSLAGIQRLCHALHKQGFEQASPGEFTKRAFLNGKLDLTQAEAIHEVIQAQNESNHIEALEKLGGSIFSYIDTIKKKLLHLVATCSVTLDYPEDEVQESVDINTEDIVQAITMIDEVLQGYDFAQLKKINFRVVLAGRTNAGKSSLFNALLKQERAIVSDVHGTTRDFLEHELMLNDMFLTLYDTAGIREIVMCDMNHDTVSSEVTVEQEGIRRSKELLMHAHVIVYVYDGNEGWTAYDTELLEHLGYSVNAAMVDLSQPEAILILVKNKIDICPHDKDAHAITSVPLHILQHSKVYADIVSVSTKQYNTISGVQKALYKSFTSGVVLPQNDVPPLSSLRQKIALEESKESLQQVLSGLKDNIPLDMISLDLDMAMKALGSITGEVTSEDVLDTVFSHFCVGK